MLLQTLRSSLSELPKLLSAISGHEDPLNRCLLTPFSVTCSQNDPKKLRQTERKEKLSSPRGEPAPGLRAEEPPDGADWAGGFVRETAGKQIVRLGLKVRDGSVRTLALV